MIRKTSYLSFILALALTGCNDDFEPVQNSAPEGSISFGTYIGNANSRASVVDASALQSSADGFGVMAYLTGADSYNSATKPNYMYNQQVVYGGGSWNYSPLKYWPASADEKISFFAYAPHTDAAASLDESESGITELPRTDAACDPVIKYEFGSDINKHVDLLYASAKDKTNADGTVNFEFKHALSRIGFKVCGWEDDGSGIDFEDNTSVTINAITLSTVRHGASLNLANGEWSESVNGEVQAFTLSGDHLLNNVIKPTDGAKQLNTEDGYMMIVPDDFIDDETSKRYCVLVDYTVETIDPNLLSGKLLVRNKVYRYLAPNFQAGKAYTINIHLGMTDNPGSGDDGTDIVGPDPVDPNPDDPTVPSTGGENSYVRFSTTVVDWVNAESLDIPLAPATPGAPEATFTANQLNLHITGSFSYANPEEAPALNTVTLLSMVKEGTTENILKGEQSFAAGGFSIPTSNIKLGELESDVKYILSLRNANGDIYTTYLTLQFGMMQMTVDIPSAGTPFVMPIKTGGTPAKLAFVWGDEAQSGEISSITVTNNQHTFESNGLKVVKILSARHESSNLQQITEFNMTTYCAAAKDFLVSMDTPILRSGQKSFQVAFQDCVNLKSIHPDLFRYHPDVTNFNMAFIRCRALESIPSGLFNYNTKATTFLQTFDSCSSLEDIPAGLFDHCKDAENFTCLFSGCTKISAIPDDLFKYNTEVTKMGSLFSHTSIESIPANLFATNTKAKMLTSAFYGTKITEIPAGLFDNCPDLYDVQNCFSYCHNLSIVPNKLFKDCTNLYYLGSLFWNCKSLVSVPADIFENCTGANSVSSLFFGCTALESIPEDLFVDCINLNTVAGLCYGCTSLTTVPEGLLRNNSKVYSLYQTFQDCTALTTVPKTIFDNLERIESAQYTFKNCSAITSEVPELWNRTVTQFNHCYSGVTNAANYADIPSNWK